LLVALAAGSFASAAEVKLLQTVAIRRAVDELIPRFEASSGHRVLAEFGTAGAIMTRVQRGEAVDVAIVTGPQSEELQKQSRFMSGSTVELAKVGIGVFVRKGAVKPDISSVEAFKRSLLAAKSIAYPDPATGAAVGIYFVSLLAPRCRCRIEAKVQVHHGRRSNVRRRRQGRRRNRIGAAQRDTG